MKKLFAFLFGMILFLSIALFDKLAYPTVHVKTQTVCEVGQPQIIIECLDPSLERYADRWREEASRRFSNALLVFVHGSDPIRGEWACKTADGFVLASDIVKRAQKEHPERTIVLLSCNTGHLKLGVPGVYYFKSSVWLIPDRACDAYEISEYKATMDDCLAPSTKPATKPTTLPFNPIFPNSWPPLIPALDIRPARHISSVTRWMIDRECNGNIFEAVTDND